MTVTRSTLLAAALAIAAGTLSACGSGDMTPVTAPPPAAQAVVVQVTPPAAPIATAGTYRFAAAVTGTADTRVTWSVIEASGGSIDAAGVYTAPGAAGTYHVRATSIADTRAYAEAPVFVAVPTAVSVSVTPSPAAVDACATLQFNATVYNATNTSTTWTVQEGAAGGTITTSGLYTAPATPGTYHVVATSVQDPTRSFVAAVTVSEHVLSVTVSPPSATLLPGQTQQFIATVTTTCGVMTSTTSVTAPL